MLRFALVGCGRISKKHSELLSGGEISGANLAAVCDIDAARAEEVGKRCGVPWFTDMDEMMNVCGDEIDIISVLTPSGMHADHAVQLSRFEKHLVIEKPMALTLEDADKMIAACDQAGTKLFIVKQNRFNKPVVKLKQALDEGSRLTDWRHLLTLAGRSQPQGCRRDCAPSFRTHQASKIEPIIGGSSG